MKNLKAQFKLIIQIILFISFFNVIEAKNLDKFNKAENMSDYFSGIASINKDEYSNSYDFFRSLTGLENVHYPYSQFFQYSLVNLNKFNEAVNYSKKLEKKKLDNFESILISAVFHLKAERYKKSEEYFKKLLAISQKGTFQDLLSSSFNNWLEFTSLDSLENSLILLKQTSDRFQNIKNIQEAFLYCYFESEDTDRVFTKLTNNSDVDYSRYNFFHSYYFINKGDKKKAIQTLNDSLKLFPRNLILNQLKIDLKNDKDFKNHFDCKNLSHVVAEIFYIAASALASQGSFTLSNFYLSLAKYLNPNFISFDALYAENFYEIEKYKRAEEIFFRMKNYGRVYNWYSSKRIASILSEQNKEKESIKFLSEEFKKIKDPNVYETYDFSAFLKNNEKYESAIKYYSKVLSKINKAHSLYPKATDGRGIAYERTKQWEKAEIDFLNSLSVEPESAYVINYLAYSWIEQGKNIEKSLEMLKKANRLRPNDGYIIDSLGWAFFKLKNYQESKKYLQLAMQLMPSDPIVNDHFADVLWMNNQTLQARYIWNYVLSLEKAEKKLKEQIKEKLLFGLRSPSA